MKRAVMTFAIDECFLTARCAVQISAAPPITFNLYLILARHGQPKQLILIVPRTAS